MIFEVKNGYFGYEKGKEILSDINFSVRENTILTILGSNGVGKTTLLKCMMGLLKWSRGNTYLEGRPAGEWNHKDFWSRIGYVPQAKLSAFSYTVEEMVLLGRTSHLKMMELPKEEDIEIMKECLNTIGISHLRYKLCSKISGGELQMVLIARALAACPSFLVLDEPESNLDFKNQIIVMAAIKNLRKEKGISSSVNTHYPEHAISISDKTLILNKKGSSVFGGSKEVITEGNLAKAFDVSVGIREISFDGYNHTCVAPLPHELS